jgi:hypothetical protein
VVESSLDVPTDCAGKLRWKTTGMFSEAVMAEPWVKLCRLETIRYKRGFFVGEILTLAVKPQWVRYMLEEIIEHSCSDFLAHTSEVCKGAHRYNEYSAFQG